MYYIGNEVHSKCSASLETVLYLIKSMEKLFSMKPVSGAKKVGDHCPEASLGTLGTSLAIIKGLRLGGLKQINFLTVWRG